MGAFLRVQVPLRVGHSEQSEAQRREGGGQQSRWWRNSNRLLRRTLNATTQRDCSARWCGGCWPGTGATPTSPRCVSMPWPHRPWGSTRSSAKQLKLDLASTSVHERERLWAYAVMVTDAAYPLEAIGQLYRDLADSENGFDELKNPWGMSGFTTQDINRCQTTARGCAPVYSGWTRMPGGVGGWGQTAPPVPDRVSGSGTAARGSSVRPESHKNTIICLDFPYCEIAVQKADSGSED